MILGEARRFRVGAALRSHAGLAARRSLRDIGHKADRYSERGGRPVEQARPLCGRGWPGARFLSSEVWKEKFDNTGGRVRDRCRALPRLVREQAAIDAAVECIRKACALVVLDAVLVGNGDLHELRGHADEGGRPYPEPSKAVMIPRPARPPHTDPYPTVRLLP